MSSASGMRRRIKNDIVAFAILCGVVITLYLRLPRHGDIWNTDASRHALNGAFVLDFLRAMPLRRPIDFALDYYRQWPGLTIGFYPPLFYVVLAVSYAIFGISEAAALVPEFAFLLLLGWAAYRLSRHWLDAAPALAVALLLVGAPELSYWGQQIMLDVPSYALLILAAGFHIQYLKGGSPRALFAAVVFAVLAIYIKYNAAFFVGVMALSLLYARGWRFALNRTALQAAGLCVVLLLPLLAEFYAFSTFNLEQAASTPGDPGRWTFEGLTYYAEVMPSATSWPTLVLAVIYCAALPFVPRLRLPKVDAAFLLTWVILGYIFYMMIAHKDPRYILHITYPFALASVLVLDRTLGRPSWRMVAPLALACSVFALTVATRPVPYVTGTRQAAQDVARLAPPETNVAVWARFDGTFIYAMRAYTGRNDLGVIRLDKLLLSDVANAFEWGFTQRNLSTEQIVEKLQALHVQYVVTQPQYLDDIDVIRRLNDALLSNKFREVERIPMTANYPFSYINELIIYRAVADVPKGRVAPPIEVKLIHKSF